MFGHEHFMFLAFFHTLSVFDLLIHGGRQSRQIHALVAGHKISFNPGILKDEVPDGSLKTIDFASYWLQIGSILVMVQKIFFRTFDFFKKFSTSEKKLTT